MNSSTFNFIVIHIRPTFSDKHPMLRDGQTGDWIGTWTGHKGAVWSCRVDPTGSLAATAGGDFCVKVFDAIVGKELRSWAHGHIVKAVAFAPLSDDAKSTPWLATGGHEGLVRLYDLTPSSDTTVGQDEPLVQIPQSPLAGSTKKVVITKLLWFTPTRLWVGCSDGTLRLWDIPAADGTTPPQPTLVQTIQVGTEEIRDMELRTGLPPDNSTRLTVAADKAVSFYQFYENDTAEPWKEVKRIEMPVHFHEEGGVSLHPAGHVFAVGGSTLWVYVFDYETGKELDCLKGHHGPIRCVRYMEPDGNLFASGSEDGTIRLWKNTFDVPSS